MRTETVLGREVAYVNCLDELDNITIDRRSAQVSIRRVSKGKEGSQVGNELTHTHTFLWQCKGERA